MKIRWPLREHLTPLMIALVIVIAIAVTAHVLGPVANPSQELPSASPFQELRVDTNVFAPK